ncbi:siderophore-interacting protein [Pseudonocardia cypriaca]|uniref:siderophore-interacting protein n=1 Tax=Pseudonocardia cypriaca TaxID=882449 RepID=UPI001FE50899|nr:siderophore-interacting protein [Pseudonocardia cypriaca]
MLTLAVQGRARISPHFVSITLGGDDVRYLERSGYDQAGRLLFAGPGQDRLALPNSAKWMLRYTLQPAGQRPRTRAYTIRRFRPDKRAFDIEIAVHQDASGGSAAPGAAWALTARPGDEVAFVDGGYTYAPTPAATWQLLVGDESALPAILAILERSSHTLPAEVFLEVPDEDDVRRDVTTPAGTRIHWLPRNDPATRPGTLALRAVRDAQLPHGRFYTWTAGEASMSTGIRRHLVTERAVPKSDITFRGYWKYGKPSP